MVVGALKEIKNNEYRVGLTPAGVQELVRAGHMVYVERGAGNGSGIDDEEYESVGAQLADAESIWANSGLIIKVKEPLEREYPFMREGQILFTYLHLAPNLSLINALKEKKISAIAYETVQLDNGALPLLTPMSEVAGRMSVQVGATLLQKYYGGRGVLLGGVPGVLRGDVLIIGGGAVGVNAARMASGLGARVTVMDINRERLSHIDAQFGGSITTVVYTEYSASKLLPHADLLIGAVLIPGAKAPWVVTEEMVKTMKPGSVIVDVSIDQGGCVETVDQITTHEEPSYTKHGVVHYSVANMPGAVPYTSTFALTGATQPYVLALANEGIGALKANVPLRRGLNVHGGNITYAAVAKASGLEYISAEEALGF